MKLLEGKVALVTGATRGIGRAIALRFAEQGANVAFTYLSSVAAAESLVAEIEALGVHAVGFASNAADFADNNRALVTIGIRPNRPATGYGYIQVADTPVQNGVNKVKTFTEKPNLEMAKVFLASGEFAWNSGMFLWRADVIVEQFNQHLSEVADKFAEGDDVYGTDNEQAFINRIYPQCPNISIDYGIMEKADNVYVMLADFGWSDLGTWSSLHEITPKDEAGNAVAKCEAMLYNAKNNMIALPEGELAVIEGLDGYLVARDNGVLLICKKDEEAKIRQYVKDAEEKFGEKYI